MSKKYEVRVLEILDSGDAIVEIPPEVVEELGWEIGDELDFRMEGKNIIVTNKSKEA